MLVQIRVDVFELNPIQKLKRFIPKQIPVQIWLGLAGQSGTSWVGRLKYKCRQTKKEPSELGHVGQLIIRSNVQVFTD